MVRRILCLLILLAGCESATRPEGLALRVEAPLAAVAGQPMGTVRASIVDQGDSIWRAARGAIVVTALDGRTIGGTSSAPLVNGVATFTGLTVDAQGLTRLAFAWDNLEAVTTLAVQPDWDVVTWGANSEDVGVWSRTRIEGTLTDTSVATALPFRAAYPVAQGEVVVFSRGSAPTIVENVAWTNSADTVTLQLRAPIVVPLTIWAVSQPLSAIRARAEEEIQRVRDIWEAERVGMVIGDVEFVDAYNFDNARTVDVGTTFVKLEEVIGRRAGRMNVYVINSFYGGDQFSQNTGVAQIGDNQLAVGKEAWRTLNHELGHNFGLLHLTPAQAGESNTMSAGRKEHIETFTEGQIFRMHFGANTALRNTLGVNPIQPRSCPEQGVPGDACPAVEWRIWQ